MRSSTDCDNGSKLEEGASTTQGQSLTTPLQQQHKTRRRRGSLRKAALLGRGARQDRGDLRSPIVESEHIVETFTSDYERSELNVNLAKHDALGFKVTSFPSTVDIFPPLTDISCFMASTSRPGQDSDGAAEPSHAYHSTTDEEDLVQIGSHSSMPPRPDLSLSSGSESYYAKQATVPRRKSFKQAKSPLSYSGISTTTLPPQDPDWDYSETEWWGWVVLTVTWFVFVMGMGSCLEVWSWAWDVGKTPYAPPELEDDPTLPIVGYYPTLIILTCVMAWVWVVVAWVGMKYFRHAKISGD